MNSLMIAHAAGLVTCLTLSKDYKDTPQLKGIGTFVMAFGVGLVFAISAYVARFKLAAQGSQVLGDLKGFGVEFDKLSAGGGKQRVSTGRQGRSGLGLEAQRQAIEQFANASRSFGSLWRLKAARARTHLHGGQSLLPRWRKLRSGAVR
jgi:hypothetical protein